MLSKLQKLREEREQGFTLIELLVVILIIGILAAIAIPAFLNQRKSAVDSSVQSDVTNAAKEIEAALIKERGQDVTVAGIAVNNPASNTVKVGATALTNLKTSKGTTLTVTNQAGGYKIVGTNPGGDVASTAGGFVYDSLTGGLK